jgi:hypothetical protein
MEGAILRLSVANFLTVGLLASAAYFGVVGAKMAISKIKTVATKGTAENV